MFQENMYGILSLDDRISIEESHRLIDEAISRHQASILALKSQKNSLITISRLPPEILCRIFWEVKKEVQLNSDNLLPACIKWIEVTHICSHWRHIAINSPSLWVDPPLGNLRWVQEMLQRSKDTGLVIEVDLNRQSKQIITPGFKLALKHSSRIKHLSVEHIYHESVWNDLQMVLPKSAPQLEYFCFTGDEPQPWLMDSGMGYDSESSVPVVISHEVLCETKRLRRLVLSECNPNWTPHLSFLCSLTHLTLHRLTLESRPTGKQFMDALKGMPDLQFLDIIDALPVEQTWVTDQIHFASLQALSIHSVYMEVEVFFRCVTFPPTAKVTVECTVERSSTAHVNFTGVIMNVSRSYSNPISDISFHTLIYLPSSFTPYRGAKFKLFTDAMADEQIVNYEYEAGDLELVFGFPAEPPVTKLMATIFSSPLPLQDVAMHSNLTWVEKDLSQPVKTIANTFGILPQLRSVSAGRYAGAILLEALQFGSQNKEMGFTDPVEKLYFPNLSSIYFDRAKFANFDLSDSVQDPTIISVESLKDYLIQRSESGAKLKNLTLKYCRNLGKREVHSLSQYVDVIDWDQHETYIDSEEDDDEEEYYEDEEIYSEDYDNSDHPLDW